MQMGLPLLQAIYLRPAVPHTAFLTPNEEDLLSPTSSAQCRKDTQGVCGSPASQLSFMSGLLGTAQDGKVELA